MIPSIKEVNLMHPIWGSGITLVQPKLFGTFIAVDVEAGSVMFRGEVNAGDQAEEEILPLFASTIGHVVFCNLLLVSTTGLTFNSAAIRRRIAMMKENIRLDDSRFSVVAWDMVKKQDFQAGYSRDTCKERFLNMTRLIDKSLVVTTDISFNREAFHDPDKVIKAADAPWNGSQPCRFIGGAHG